MMNDKKLKLYASAVISILCLVLSSSISSGETIKSDEALKLLKEGNERFIEMKLRHPDETVEQREKTAVNGQTPFAAVLACSDSRVPVEAIFDRGIGDIFVVRVAGNIVMDNGVIGSIEYAAEHLNTPLLVIMGHTGCGAVKAAVDDSIVEGKIRYIKKQIRPTAVKTKKEHPDLAGPDLINAVAKNNALQAKKELLYLSHGVKEMTDEGRLKIVTAVYDIKTGKVEWIE
ncbi:MAG: carbonic anhydrase [Candidatus Omnitrophota bacterium]|nr:carbonic anhydrase [Candidatus Omnitrophota bacterium]